MVTYFNAHVALENRRNKAAAAAAIAQVNGQPMGGAVNVATARRGQDDRGTTGHRV